MARVLAEWLRGGKGVACYEGRQRKESPSTGPGAAEANLSSFAEPVP